MTRIPVGYWLADSPKEADRYPLVTDFARLYHCWWRRGYELDSEESDESLVDRTLQRVQRAARDGKQIVAALNLQDRGKRKTPVRRFLNLLKPFWSAVRFVELADEDGRDEDGTPWLWDGDNTRAERERVSAIVFDLGLEGRPFSLTSTTGFWLAARGRRTAAQLDICSPELYVNPPHFDDRGDHPMDSGDWRRNNAVLRDRLDQIARTIEPTVKIAPVLQGYARNPDSRAGHEGEYNWKDADSLRQLNAFGFEYARLLGDRCPFVAIFSLGRATGTVDLEYKGWDLLRIHRQGAAKIWEEDVPAPPAPPGPPMPPTPPAPAPKSWLQRLVEWLRKLFG